MSTQSQNLQRQADRAESIADQTADDSVRDILRNAARDYREEASREPSSERTSYALFRGDTQLARTYSTEEQAMSAALFEGLIPEMPRAGEAGARILPPGFRIEKVEQPYEPQPDWKLPREIS